ncbi:hypothetical protein SARC_12968, partial [Sphaeroforma arctica JP610]
MGDADTLSILARVDDEAVAVVMTLLGDGDKLTTDELLLASMASAGDTPATD